jgi:hypothetical protein
MDKEDQRLARMIEKRGFEGALRWIARRADKLNREDQIRLLETIERTIKSHVERAATMAHIWRTTPSAPSKQATRLAKIKALANDARGNTNERAAARRAADRLKL